MQLCCVLPALEAAGGLEPARHIFGICGMGDVVFRRLAHRYGLRLLDHEADIGGRFAAFCRMSACYCQRFWPDATLKLSAPARVKTSPPCLRMTQMDHAAAQGAALQYAHMQAGRMVSVLMLLC
ncbi:MAG: hypothetical protein CM15mP55_0930 [Hyphomicrobiales bacterium]|nr:MAG: hypothetical protein CM15mP55_0930 [Hyphomicrobiales bacterium]